MPKSSFLTFSNTNFKVLYFWSFFGVGSKSQVAKDAKEQKKRHAKNLWPDTHLIDCEVK